MFDEPSAQSLKELHELGATKEEIEDTLRIMPFVRLLPCHSLFSFQTAYTAPCHGTRRNRPEVQGQDDLLLPVKREFRLHQHYTGGEQTVDFSRRHQRS